MLGKITAKNAKLGRVICINWKSVTVEALWFGCYGAIIWFLSGWNKSEWFLLFSLSDIFCVNRVKDSGYTNILQDKTLFCAFEAGNIVCWLVNPPIAKLDLFKSPNCRWICPYAEYCYRNLATVHGLVQSPTLQSTIFCGVHSDLRGKGIRVSPACSLAQFSVRALCKFIITSLRSYALG